MTHPASTQPGVKELVEELRQLSSLQPGWYANVGARTGERCCAAMRQAADALQALEARESSLLNTIRELREAGDVVQRWLSGLADIDMDDVVADGGVTAAMVVQQEARGMASRLAKSLSTPSLLGRGGEEASQSQPCGRASADAEVSAGQQPAPSAVLDIQALTDRFLSWPVPRAECADRCASTHDYAYQRYGTHFLSAAGAKQMLRHVLAPGHPTTSSDEGER